MIEKIEAYREKGEQKGLGVSGIDVRRNETPIRKKGKQRDAMAAPQSKKNNRSKTPEARRAESLILYSSIIWLAVSEISFLYKTEVISVPLGILLYSAMLLGLLAGIGLLNRAEEKEGYLKYGHSADLLKTLMILPLTRIFGFTLPLLLFRQTFWPLIISIPLLITVWVLARNLNLTLKDVGLVGGSVRSQLPVALFGIFLGFLEYVILRPNPIVEAPTVGNMLVPGIILVMFTGFTEELIFRGFLQTIATRCMGALQGVLYVSILFTLMHIAYGSAIEMLYVFCVALLYGIIFYRTKTLWGVMLSHGVANVVLLMIAPFVL
jgi:membrane protease YdiL (CAAX protease family)